MVVLVKRDSMVDVERTEPDLLPSDGLTLSVGQVVQSYHVFLDERMLFNLPILNTPAPCKPV
jgi:hypothetical protein